MLPARPVDLKTGHSDDPRADKCAAGQFFPPSSYFGQGNMRVGIPHTSDAVREEQGKVSVATLGRERMSVHIP